MTPSARSLTPLQWLICAIAALGFAFDIYEILMAPLVVGPAIGELTGNKPGMPDFNFWVGMFFWVPAIFGGAFGLLGGYLTDRFGRRRVLTWSILLYAFSALAAGFATNIYMLLFLRSTTYIGVFVEFVAAVAWIAEIFPDAKQREKALGYTQAFSSIGGVMVTGAYAIAVTYAQSFPAIAGSHAPWRYTLISGVLPALPLILIRPFLPESPAWQEKKAAGTLRRPSIAQLFTPELRRTTIVTTLMFAFAYGAAFGAIQQMPRIVPGLAEVRVLPPQQQQQTASLVQAYQEFGGLAGRFLLAVLALYVVSRRKLIRTFQIPGLVVMVFVFYYAATHSLEMTKLGMFFAGVFTVGQLSFWGNYLPRVFPTHLRGTGEGFAANIGGRMLGTGFAFVTTQLVNVVPGATPTARLALAATMVAAFVYTAGLICSFFYRNRSGTRFQNKVPRVPGVPIVPKVLVLVLVGCQMLLAAEQWPQFRGPGATGVAEGKNLPDTWSTTQNIKWKTTIPGNGWSSPIAWGDRIFVTSVTAVGEIEAPKRGLYLQGERPAPAIEHRYAAYAISFATGKILWQRGLHHGFPPGARHLKNTFASETPVTDGRFVYAAFGNVGIYAMDFDGELVWSKPIDAKATRNGWGTASSPVLHEGRLYFVNDNEDASSLIAVDAATGKTIWSVERPKETNWATPFIWRHGGRTEIVTNGTSAIRSYGLDGTPLWQLRPSSTHVIPTPFAAGDLLYVSSGYVGDPTRPVYAIKPGGSGDISLKTGETSNTFVAWSLPQGGTYNVSPIVYGDYYYTLFDRGFVTCHDAKTGKEIYTKVRLDPTASGFTASPWAYNGKIFAMSEDGTTYVIQAGPEFKVIGQNVLDEFTMASPAIHRDSLIVRTTSTLYRIAK